MKEQAKTIFYAEYNQLIGKSYEKTTENLNAMFKLTNSKISKEDLNKVYINFLRENKITNPEFGVIFDTYPNMPTYIFSDIASKCGFETKKFQEIDDKVIYYFHNKKERQTIYLESSDKNGKIATVKEAYLFGYSGFDSDEKRFIYTDAQNGLIKQLAASKEGVETLDTNYFSERLYKERMVKNILFDTRLLRPGINQDKLEGVLPEEILLSLGKTSDKNKGYTKVNNEK